MTLITFTDAMSLFRWSSDSLSICFSRTTSFDLKNIFSSPRGQIIST